MDCIKKYKKYHYKNYLDENNIGGFINRSKKINIKFLDYDIILKLCNIKLGRTSDFDKIRNSVIDGLNRLTIFDTQNIVNVIISLEIPIFKLILYYQNNIIAVHYKIDISFPVSFRQLQYKNGTILLFGDVHNSDNNLCEEKCGVATLNEFVDDLIDVFRNKIHINIFVEDVNPEDTKYFRDRGDPIKKDNYPLTFFISKFASCYSKDKLQSF